MSDSNPTADIESVIHLVRGLRVMLSTDLAKLYQVAPKTLVQAVKRNRERFPDDFMFHLTISETRSLKDGKTALGWGNYEKYPPYAFTEQGVAMLASILKSHKAIRVNVAIVRVFVRLRGALSIQRAVIRKLSELERKIQGHDDQLAILAEAIQDLELMPEESPKQIGFQP